MQHQAGQLTGHYWNFQLGVYNQSVTDILSVATARPCLI